MTKQEAIENVKAAKEELKNQLEVEDVQMKGWGKAAAYRTISQLMKLLKPYSRKQRGYKIPGGIDFNDIDIFEKLDK